MIDFAFDFIVMAYLAILALPLAVKMALITNFVVLYPFMYGVVKGWTTDPTCVIGKNEWGSITCLTHGKANDNLKCLEHPIVKGFFWWAYIPYRTIIKPIGRGLWFALKGIGVAAAVLARTGENMMTPRQVVIPKPRTQVTSLGDAPPVGRRVLTSGSDYDEAC